MYTTIKTPERKPKYHEIARETPTIVKNVIEPKAKIFRF